MSLNIFFALLLVYHLHITTSLVKDELSTDKLNYILENRDMLRRIMSSSYSYRSSSNEKRCQIQANFDIGGAVGYIKAKYVSEDTVDFDVDIDFGEFLTGDGNRITPGTKLNWHLHTNWNHHGMKSASNDMCGFDFTGNHYDPTVACSSASEWIDPSDGYCYGPEGQIKNSADYSCSPSSNWQETCERGDESAKLGPFVVEEHSDGSDKVHYKGRDDFFATQTAARSGQAEDWSFVIHLGKSRILCAKVEIEC